MRRQCHRCGKWKNSFPDDYMDIYCSECKKEVKKIDRNSNKKGNLE